MALFVIFITWIAVLSVAIMVAWDERSTSAYITLVILALVLMLIVFVAMFDPRLLGV